MIQFLQKTKEEKHKEHIIELDWKFAYVNTRREKFPLPIMLRVLRLSFLVLVSKCSGKCVSKRYNNKVPSFTITWVQYFKIKGLAYFKKEDFLYSR